MDTTTRLPFSIDESRAHLESAPRDPVPARGDGVREPAFVVYVEATLPALERDGVASQESVEDIVEDIVDDLETLLEDAGFTVVMTNEIGFMAVRAAIEPTSQLASDWRSLVFAGQSSYQILRERVPESVRCTVFVHADSALARPVGDGFQTEPREVATLAAWLARNLEEGIHYTTGSTRDLMRRHHM